MTLEQLKRILATFDDHYNLTLNLKGELNRKNVKKYAGCFGYSNLDREEILDDYFALKDMVDCIEAQETFYVSYTIQKGEVSTRGPA